MRNVSVTEVLVELSKCQSSYLLPIQKFHYQDSKKRFKHFKIAEKPLSLKSKLGFCFSTMKLGAVGTVKSRCEQS